MEYPRQLERAMNTLADSERYDVENTASAGQNLGSFTKRVEKVIATVLPRMAVIYPSPASYIDPPSANDDNWVPIGDPPFKLRMVKKFFDSLDRLPEWVRTLRHQLKIWRFTSRDPGSGTHRPRGRHRESFGASKTALLGTGCERRLT